MLRLFCDFCGRIATIDIGHGWYFACRRCCFDNATIEEFDLKGMEAALLEDTISLYE